MKEMQQVDIVLVHDAARPFITHDIIAKLVQNAHDHGAAIAGVRAKDTMKKYQRMALLRKRLIAKAYGWCKHHKHSALS